MPTTICAPACKRAALALRIHAADAGADARAGEGDRARSVRARPASASSRVGATTSASGAPAGGRASAVAQQRLRHRDAIGDGLARAGLRGDEEIAPRRLRARVTAACTGVGST